MTAIEVALHANSSIFDRLVRTYGLAFTDVRPRRPAASAPCSCPAPLALLLFSS